jgi:nicotinic acid mononucleotide adenylyltransferase
MEIVRRQAGARPSAALGILPGAFNPPTVAHIALADASQNAVAEVLFVVPRAYPHKQFEGATLEQRIEMLTRASTHGIAISEGGLFIEIARETKSLFGPETEPWIICGRDAAERIIAWDYGDGGSIEEMLNHFGLLVADRGGRYQPPPYLRERIRNLEMPPSFDWISSSEIRRRMAAREEWEPLVPPEIVDLARTIY